MNGATSLAEHLAECARSGTPQALCDLVQQVAGACIQIGQQVRRGALAGILGSASSRNVQGEEQQQLDVIANRILMDTVASGGRAAALASEEMEQIQVTAQGKNHPPYLVLFDPLDGSSNIAVNVSIGTIFSVLSMPQARLRPETADFLQPGREQAAAGYCIYGPQTTLVLTLGDGVAMFTLEPQREVFVRTARRVRIPAETREFAINMSNRRHWDAPVRRYIDECLAGTEGVRAKDFNMRWVASMVADVHRILSRGGIFLYPWDRREPNRPGKLRLMYEANPMAWLVEQAGGTATNGRDRILDIVPQQLHERVSVILGSADEVQRVTSYHLQSSDTLPNPP